MGFEAREPGAVFYAFLESAQSGLVMEYEDCDTNGNCEQKRFTFTMSSAANKFHRLERSDYQTRLMGSALAASDHRYEFMQSSLMIRNYLRFPHLKNIGLVGVNKAEFILRVDPVFLGSADRYQPPGQIRVLLADEKGDFLRTDEGERIINNVVSFDEDENAYVFPLTGYVQQALSGRIANNGLILEPADTANTLNRAIFGGVLHPELNPELRIFYTKLSP